MFQSAYALELEDSAHTLRQRESEAFERAIGLLQDAQDLGFRSPKGIEAVFFTNRVWAFLIEDLSLSDNDLPDNVRANLISIGLHILKRLDEVRKDNAADASDIIELMEIIKGALK